MCITKLVKTAFRDCTHHFVKILVGQGGYIKEVVQEIRLGKVLSLVCGNLSIVLKIYLVAT